MKSRFFANGLAALALLLLLAGAAQAGAAGVLVFGDSLSAGYGIANGKGWVDLLGERLRADAQGENAQAVTVPVINASASGETTQGGLTRIDDVLARHRPDVLILELGGNDALRGLALDRTKRNLATMITRARAGGARVLLLGMQVPPNLGPAYTKRFKSLFRELHDELHVAWVPFFLQGIAGNEQLMQRDGLHPTAQAQPQLLENVWPTLRALLQRND
ncbi:MAG: acyl-CoA thioesterase-1 [Gammaproteobacteria bacterium]